MTNRHQSRRLHEPVRKSVAVFCGVHSANVGCFQPLLGLATVGALLTHFITPQRSTSKPLVPCTISVATSADANWGCSWATSCSPGRLEHSGAHLHPAASVQ